MLRYFRQLCVLMDTIARRGPATHTPSPVRPASTGTTHLVTVERCVFYVQPGITATDRELTDPQSALR